MGRSLYVRTLKKDELLLCKQHFQLNIDDTATVDELRRVISQHIKENDLTIGDFPDLPGSRIDVLFAPSRAPSPAADLIAPPTFSISNAAGSAITPSNDSLAAALTSLAQAVEQLKSPSPAPESPNSQLFRFMRECSSRKISFSGKPSENVQYFISQIDSILKFFQISDTDVAKVLPEVLRDNALDTLRAFPNNFSTWTQTSQTLKSLYSTSSSDCQLLAELYSRLQHENETILQFVTTIKNMNDRLNQPKSDDELVQLISNNLNPAYRREFKHFRPSSLEGVIKLGRSFEQEIEKDLAYAKAYKNSNVLSSVIPQAEIAAASAPRPSMLKDPSYCLKCLQNGHLAKDCKNPRRPYCTRCFKMDVYASNCPCKNRPFPAGNGDYSPNPQVGKGIPKTSNVATTTLDLIDFSTEN